MTYILTRRVFFESFLSLSSYHGDQRNPQCIRQCKTRKYFTVRLRLYYITQYINIYCGLQYIYILWSPICILWSPIYHTYWLETISKTQGQSKQGSNKLRTYCLFKSHLQKEPYCSLQDKDLRRNMAKLRCSDHNLRIETGRREGIPAEQRLCRLCSLNKIENEEHFLLECPVYQPLRVKLFLAFEKEIRTFHSFDNRQKFIYLMSCEDQKLLLEVTKYIRDAFKLRPNIPALIP